MIAATTLRWGIMGCARITRRGLIPGIRSSRTGALSALASRDRATAQAWASEFGIPKAMGRTRSYSTTPRSTPSIFRFPTSCTSPG